MKLRENLQATGKEIASARYLYFPSFKLTFYLYGVQ